MNLVILQKKIFSLITEFTKMDAPMEEKLKENKATFLETKKNCYYLALQISVFEP